MKTYKWFIITALVLALSMPATPVSAQVPSASNTLTSPSPNPGRVGSEVSLALVLTVENINPGVTAAEIYLAYDDTLVAPPASPLGVVEALPDFFGVSNVSINEVLPKAQCPGGTSPCIHLAVAGPAQTTHSGAAARFHFRGITNGTACFRVLTSAMVDANGFQVTHVPASPVCVTIIRTTIDGTVKRQGTPANPNSGGGTLACSVVKVTSGALTVGPVFTDGSGNFTLTDVPSGAHNLRAEYSGYLASEKTITISAGGPPSINVGMTTLLGGDVNGDKSINILDIGKIISLFGRTGVPVGSSDPTNCNRSDEPTDINDDGNINISDLAIAAGNWGRTGPTLWP